MIKAAIYGTSRITKQGQVTIPKKIRQKLGLEQGDSVQFILTENDLLLIKKLGFDVEIEL
ncbi:MAG: AbrB/MazE/SpoVT family DNA-binding domain-containing protein [Methanosarcinales archaeon]